MNRTEHLLTILSEECAEVAQRASKALRFGLEEAQPGHATNASRITQELNDLLGVMKMLVDEGLIPEPDLGAADAKRDRVEEYLRYSDVCGTLTRPIATGGAT